MLSRLFHTSDSTANPAVAYGTSTSNSSGSVYSFLAPADRELVAKAYEFAGAHDIDPTKVDDLAFDLAIYRRAGPSGPMDTTGKLFDLQGRPIVSQLKPADEAVAARIHSSNVGAETEIDHGFLESVLDPGRTPVHAVDFEFLEDVVYALSASGADGSTNPNASIPPRAGDNPNPNASKPTSPSQEDANGDARATVLTRLFGTKEAISPPSVATVDIGSRSARLLDYLTPADRDLFSRIYSWAEASGQDLAKVDELAVSMGSYRARASLMQHLLSSGRSAQQMGNDALGRLNRMQ